MKTHKKLKPQLIVVVITIIIIIVVLCIFLLRLRGNSSTTKADTGHQASTQAPPSRSSVSTAHSSQDAVSFVQQTYDSYLQAVNNTNEYNSSHSGNSNQPLPQAGLDAVKNDLDSAVYSKLKKEEQTKGGDKFGCATYQVDHYMATIIDTNSSTASIGVGTYNSYGDNNGTITVQVDLSKLLINGVTCP